MIHKKIESVRHSLSGLLIAWREEANFKIEIACGIVVILAAFVLHISHIELAVVALLIGFVLATEALNTALEEFCDMVKSEHDPHIAKIKDLAAASVLISSITALVIGSVIFIPYIFSL